MIDLHCHILPGVDDGALDVADSLAMARQALEDGIEAICATPHIRHDHDVRIPELPARVAELQTALDRSGIRVRVLPGGEVAETALDGLLDEELRAVSLGGGGRWILLEPRAGPLTRSILNSVRSLARRGFRSVIAHPERHMDPDATLWLTAAVRAGALVQATAALVVPDLAAQGLIHVVGSDAHSSHGGRPVHLSGGLAELAEIERVAPHLEWVARVAPGAIVGGDDVRAPYAAG